ncbi:MAG TPA: hypothetical protein DIS76_07225, partial [Rhodospirillaceae bacterium]|nr:hypothetical protein [Rhodospirillaceae bacterium]
MFAQLVSRIKNNPRFLGLLAFTAIAGSAFAGTEAPENNNTTPNTANVSGSALPANYSNVMSLKITAGPDKGKVIFWDCDQPDAINMLSKKYGNDFVDISGSRPFRQGMKIENPGAATKPAVRVASTAPAPTIEVQREVAPANPSLTEKPPVVNVKIETGAVADPVISTAGEGAAQTTQTETAAVAAASTNEAVTPPAGATTESTSAADPLPIKLDFNPRTSYFSDLRAFSFNEPSTSSNPQGGPVLPQEKRNNFAPISGSIFLAGWAQSQNGAVAGRYNTPNGLLRGGEIIWGANLSSGNWSMNTSWYVHDYNRELYRFRLTNDWGDGAITVMKKGINDEAGVGGVDSNTVDLGGYKYATQSPEQSGRGGLEPRTMNMNGIQYRHGTWNDNYKLTIYQDNRPDVSGTFFNASVTRPFLNAGGSGHWSAMYNSQKQGLDAYVNYRAANGLRYSGEVYFSPDNHFAWAQVEKP